ncbi:MAG: phosphoglycerate kinase, partial [Armatimonadota bacterium]|nr:phosphoglycerate kinase [Armatimonadota bacterium]
MNKKTVKDIDAAGKRVLVRVDFNVPLDENRNITDDRRIVAALETIWDLIMKNARVILMSHLGRPKFDESGRADAESAKKYNLNPVAERLRECLDSPFYAKHWSDGKLHTKQFLWGGRFTKLNDCIGDEVKAEA